MSPDIRLTLSEGKLEKLCKMEQFDIRADVKSPIDLETGQVKSSNSTKSASGKQVRRFNPQGWMVDTDQNVSTSATAWAKSCGAS
jgi:hypothetical protein